MDTHPQHNDESALRWHALVAQAVGEYRQWEMTHTPPDVDPEEGLEEVTGDIPSIIAPEEPFDPDQKPEIDPAPPQPELPTPPAHPNIPPRTSSPFQTNGPAQNDNPPQNNAIINPVSPTELPPHIAPKH